MKLKRPFSFLLLLALITQALTFSMPSAGQIPISKIVGLQSFINDTANAKSTIKGLFNFEIGMRNWRIARSRAGKNIAGTGFGGVDVVFLGDSVEVGAYASSYLFDTWPALLRNKIQDKYNPPGVQGGAGYVPFHINDTTWVHSDTPAAQANNTLWTMDTPANWTLEGGVNTIFGAKMIRSRTATSGAASRARFVFDGSLPARKRMQVTDIEPVASTFGSDGTITYDRLTSDAFVAVGAGASTGTLPTSMATNIDVHCGRLLTGLTATSVNGIQYSQASGSTTIRVGGVIAYYNDWDCGFRFHNLALGGQRSDALPAASQVLAANTTKWGSTAPGGTPAGATQAGLFIINFLLNDIGISGTPVVDLASYIANMGTIIDACLACPSRPSVLIWIPQCRNNANTLIYYPQYVAALYALAKSKGVAIFDMWKFNNNDTYNNSNLLYGWGFGDGTHWNDLGNEAMADLMEAILMRTGSLRTFDRKPRAETILKDRVEYALQA